MGLLELITLVILAVLLFGPDKLPEVIENVMGFLRNVRAFSENAKNEIRSELGPGFKDFEFEDLHPRTFLSKHVLNGDGDILGLDEIRNALDPRQELTEITDTLREAADGTTERPSATEPGPLRAAHTPVSFTKAIDTASNGLDWGGGTVPVPFDHEAT